MKYTLTRFIAPVAVLAVVGGVFWYVPGFASPTPAEQAEIAIGYFKTNHRDLATEAFKQALAMDPRNFRALYGAGTMAYQQSEYPKAIPLLRAAVDLEPGNQEAALTLGAAYQKSGDAPNADAVYQKILKQNPTNYRALFNLGDMNIDIMHYPVARGYYTKLLSVQPRCELAPDAKMRIRQIDQYLKGPVKK